MEVARPAAAIAATKTSVFVLIFIVVSIVVTVCIANIAKLPEAVNRFLNFF